MQCFSLRDLFKIEKQCGNSAAVKANRLRDLSWEWQCILRDSRFWSAPRCSSQCEKPFIISLSLSRPFSISLYIKFCFPPYYVPATVFCTRISQPDDPIGKYSSYDIQYLNYYHGIQKYAVQMSLEFWNFIIIFFFLLHNTVLMFRFQPIFLLSADNIVCCLQVEEKHTWRIISIATLSIISFWEKKKILGKNQGKSEWA